MNRAKMMMRFEPHMEKNIFKLFIYDTVTKKGTFDWSTWETVDSKTSAQYFADQLSQIPDNAEIELYINSNGGSVSEGVAIYNQLKRHPAQKTGYVDGIAYSVASLILQACDKRIMGLGTSMLVHEMWVEVAGNARMLRSAADDLDNWMKANRKVYMERSGMSEEELIALMGEERILTPEECLSMGFIDEISEKLSEDDPDDDTENNPEDDPEDNPENDPEESTDDDMDDDSEDDLEDDSDDESDDDPDDDPDGDSPQEYVLKNIKQYFDMRESLLKSTHQMTDVSKRRKKNVQNKAKCIQFFDRFYS